MVDNKKSKSVQLIELTDHLIAVRKVLRNEPNPNPSREVGRATSLTLTKVEEAMFWLTEAINAQLAEEARNKNN